MTNIDAIAPKKASVEAQEFIEALWDAFLENYNAFKAGEMKLEDEVKFNLFSAPGPVQYNAYAQFFDLLEDEEQQVWDVYKDYMFMHDFAELDKQTEPAILEFLLNLYSSGYDPGNKTFTMASGSFWARHIPTREKIISHFEKLHERNANLRIVTKAKQDEKYIGDLISLLKQDSHFNMPRRIPIHFVQADGDFLYNELPHTESSVLRLNMLLDLNNLRFKKGKTKADLLRFLDTIIEEAL